MAEPPGFDRTCTVFIEKVASGEVHEYKTGYFVCTDTPCYHEDENKFGFHDYIWREGNFSCDCNRILFFGGFEEKYYHDDCSEGRYRIVSLVDDETGTLLYSEPKGWLKK
jgi:hypothetical protein